jgi:hypothetical protein
MAKHSLPISIFTGIICFFILLSVNACASQPLAPGNTNTLITGTQSGTPSQSVNSGGTNTSASGTQSANSSQSSVQTVPMPPTNTSCPATNTARAAVMRPLALGTHQNLVYIYNDVPQHTSTAYGRLRRYDTTSGQKIDIASSGIQILQAQVSSDGQWILFLSMPDPRGAPTEVVQLQLVRMDGQGLQTLLCLPYTNSGRGPLSTPNIAFQWSADEQSIIISDTTLNAGTQQAVSSISVLNVSTGALKPTFLDPADNQYLYSVVTWLDMTHAYILKRSISSPTLPATLFLMNTVTATVANPGLQNVLDVPAGTFTMDSSYDGTKLFVSSCIPASVGTITARPATGGTSQTIYSSGNDCALTLRAVATNTLLLVAEVSNYASYQIWTMHPDGTGKQVLNTLSVAVAYELNTSSQFPWSNVSRDGTTYALQQGAAIPGQSVILMGALSGGSPTVIASTAGSLSTASLAGWTTM